MNGSGRGPYGAGASPGTSSTSTASSTGTSGTSAAPGPAGSGPASPPPPPSPGRHRVVIALGSNLGDRLDNLQAGLDSLFDSPGLSFVAVSPVFETTPAGGPPQPDYFNAVLIAETALPARAVLERCQGIEAAFGRTRTERWGPRTLDLDLIVYGDQVSDDPELTLPHPRAHARGFVLAPWLAADPDAQIPGRGRVGDLLARVGLAGVRRLDGVVLHAPA